MTVLGVKPVLYHYWRSTCSWRVRLALAIKGVDVDFVAVDLLNGESESKEHLARNPMGFVPALDIGRGRMLIESVAIIEWLEENFPQPQLYPGDSQFRARIRALVEIVNAGTQPLQNLSVTDFHSSDANEKLRWNQHFIRNGLRAFESLVSTTATTYCMGSRLTAADLFLVPQCYNAVRFGIPLSEFKLLERVVANTSSLPAFVSAHPDRYKP